MTGRMRAKDTRLPRTRSARGGKPVPGAAHRLDHPVLAERFQREAQPPDMDVDGALLDVHLVAPDLIEQLGARVHALGARQEEAEQPELGRAERDRRARRR